MQTTKDPYNEYVAMFTFVAAGGHPATMDTAPTPEVNVAIALGAADGVQARGIAGQVGMPPLADLLRAKSVIEQEVKKRLDDSAT